MQLAVDIGNTSIKFGVFGGLKLLKCYQMPAPDNISGFNQISGIIEKLNNSKYKISQIGISSVVPNNDKKIEILILTAFKIKPLNVSVKVDLPIIIKLKNKYGLGADRICNAVFGYEYFNRKENVLIIDTGTAVTYDLVKKNGDYEGGLIAPGINTMGLSLHLKTAKLPLINFTVKSGNPKHFIGKNTESAIKSGVYFSFVESMNGIITRYKKEVKGDLKVILTGGLTNIFKNDIKHDYEHIENTVLKGINYILMYNNVF